MRLLLATLSCCLVLGACTDATPVAEPTTEPPATVEPEPEPDPEAEPVTVRVKRIVPVSTDNASVFGRTRAEPDMGAAEAAVADAVAVLERYLDEQFRDPDTRLSDAPLETLLLPQALRSLDAHERQVLGDVGLPVTWTVTGPVEVNARVLMHNDEARAVALSLDARVWAAFEPGKDAPLEMIAQRGNMLFHPSEEVGWKVAAFDVRLIGPDALALATEDES